jgi:hypothetical protein
MGKRWRRQCDGTQCRDPTHFHPARAPTGSDPFFKPVGGAADVPDVHKQDEAPAAEPEHEDPLVDGLKTTGEQLLEHEPFKKWYEPKARYLKLKLWDELKPGEKAALLGFAGVNIGMAGAAFASNPQLRAALSDTNIAKPLGWIPYSPIAGFKYKLPGAGKTATEYSVDFTLNPYLELLQKRRPGFPLTGATFGLESSYDPQGGFNLTGGRFGLDLLGGGLKAEGRTFNELSPYPQLLMGRDGMPPSWLMHESPGMPNLKTGPGYQFTLKADMLKLFPSLRKHF